MDAIRLVSCQTPDPLLLGRASFGAIAGPLVVLIAGGSASGKTCLAKRIVAQAGEDQVAYLPQDAYYKERRRMPAELLERNNFDHPEAVDQELLTAHAGVLRAGVPIEMPTYDFTISDRLQETRSIFPKPIILVDGLFVLGYEPLRALAHIRLYVTWPEVLRLVRRLRRDTIERGRTVNSVMRQYFSTVRPMHAKFVEPSKRYAHRVVLGNDHGCREATDLVMSYISGENITELTGRRGSPKPVFIPWYGRHVPARNALTAV